MVRLASRVEIEKETLQRIHAVELEIALVIGELCSKHGITWWFDSGSALGAIRHAGFIPWDDDIDLGMMREDYDRFLEIAEKELPAGYSIHTPSNTRGFAGMFAKVYKDGTKFYTAETMAAGCNQCIFVDILPYDAVYADKERREKQTANAILWQRVSYLYHSGEITVPHKGLMGTVEKIACRIAHPIVHALNTPEKIERKFSESRSEEGYDEGLYCVLSFPTEAFARDVLLPTTTAMFEGHEVPVPAKTDEYLTIWFGDWRKLPPEEDRKTHLPLVVEF